MRLKYAIIISFLIVFKGISYAQEEIRFNHLTTENGLSNATINPILQDSAGYIWFGTIDGLCRYDGNSISTYRHKNHDSNSITNNEIICLCEDIHHLIWIGTSYGLSSFNPITQKFTDYYFNKWSESPRNNAIKVITQGANKFLWVGTYDGLYRLNVDSGRWVNVKIVPGNSSKMDIRGIIATTAGRLFVATDSGLVYSDNDGKSFIPLPSFSKSIEGKHFSSLYLDSKERLWIGIWENSFIYEIDSKTFQLKEYVFDTAAPLYKDRNNAAHAMLLLNDSMLMIGAIISGIPESGGLYLLNIKTGKTHRYNHSNHDPYSLSSNHIYSLYTDKQKTIWVGTSDGINYFNYRQLNFHPLEPPDNRDSSVFTGYDIRLVNNRESNFWILGSDGNLFDYSISENALTAPKFIGKVVAPKLDGFSTCIYSLGDSIFIGTSKGLILLRINQSDFNNPVITKFPAKPFDQAYITGILKDKTGSFWIEINYDGVYKYTPSTMEIKHYLYKNEPNAINPPSGLIDDECIAEDNKGNIWVGTGTNGFCCIYPSSGKVEWNKLLDKQMDSKSLGEVDDIYCDTNAIYISTTRAGLLAIDTRKGILSEYTVEDGLSNNDIAKIIPGDKNYLWLPTRKGLSCFDKLSKKFRNYFKANGLLSDVFSFSGGVFNSGKIIFNSNTCIQYFTPSSLLNSTLPVFPEFTSMQVNNKEYNNDLSQKISLRYKDNIISFTFSAFDFINNTEDKFAYKLEGLDDDWNYCGNRRYAEYTNLPGGDYTLKLKVQTTDGAWVETARPILLHIATPYWKTGWFFMVCGIAAFAMGYLFYYLKMQRKLEAERLRTRLARDLHDDIGSSLSSISILSDMAGKSISTSPEETRIIFHKISESSHKTMESMKDIVWTVNPENDTMDSLLTRMRIYTSEMLEPLGIDYHFKAGEEVENSKLGMEQRRNFYLIFKEAINNIAKYSKCRNVSITIYKLEENMEMKITDNGIGFNSVNNANRGNGLKNMSERAKVMSGNFIIESIEGKGTTLMLNFPLT